MRREGAECCPVLDNDVGERRAFSRVDFGQREDQERNSDRDNAVTEGDDPVDSCSSFICHPLAPALRQISRLRRPWQSTGVSQTVRDADEITLTSRRLRRVARRDRRSVSQPIAVRARRRWQTARRPLVRRRRRQQRAHPRSRAYAREARREDPRARRRYLARRAGNVSQSSGGAKLGRHRAYPVEVTNPVSRP